MLHIGRFRIDPDFGGGQKKGGTSGHGDIHAPSPHLSLNLIYVSRNTHTLSKFDKLN
jgi:hypothetical protein